MIVKEKVRMDDKEISFEIGRMAREAGGGVCVWQGDSVVLVTVCASYNEKKEGFFPLTCDYVEKTFAAGKIPGGFFKREGRPSDYEVLSSRLIDRPIRPLFPKEFSNETQIIATVFSADRENPTDVLAVCGASMALMVSDIPWDGPVGAVRVGLVDGGYVVNPTFSELEDSQMDIIVAGSKDGIVMVEGEAKEVEEEKILDSFFFAFERIKTIIDLQEKIASSIGKEKRKVELREVSQKLQDILKKVEDMAIEKIEDICKTKGRKERSGKLDSLKKSIMDTVGDAIEPGEFEVIDELIAQLYKKVMRRRILSEGIRIDGRKSNEIRNITCEVGILPRVHGSGLFTRGETQAIVTTTLGTKADEQRIDDLLGERSKRFMLHYNFPPYSVGEVKPLRAPSRREIGHGNLAERSLNPVIPQQETFPYTIRVVSEILESNGSSSMATVCGATLSLMDAGVPIKAPVAGIAMGLVFDEETGKAVVLSDIIGEEDHYGDMDFKVAGTNKGITGLQMDIKVKGVTREILFTALSQAKEGRKFILNRMLQTIPTYRPELSVYAPRVKTIKVKPERIREIIGPGGKTIRGLQDQTGCSIEIEDDGTVNIYTPDQESMDEAVAIIRNLVKEAEMGHIYMGKVKSVKEFGAFVEILPGVDGLVHISELAPHRVKNVEEVCKEGDILKVRVVGIDSQGKIKLTHKEFWKGKERK